MSFRIGQGIDVHAFGPGDHVVLGGVTIPYELGLVAHSDGDVLLHALADALLGALALGDIGKHFPDTDEAYSGADSRMLLRHVIGLITERGYRLVNADATLVAQAPKMAPHIDAMRENIASDCGVDAECISVKATTSEKLGFTGRKEGIAAQAVVLLEARGSCASE
ncbi:2-C-methyl-D-erythritol 2,4-cyclodiphosphate synthase [Microbulbifer sp. YPW1]|uniref:2-C-methyl-D-erythritol 2,4-cyclodiphosphate synthase n=1 Tax=Microbulbifer sp. YPW1 TaxID=2745199 RepID=UPI00159B763B|nr:2-C-methyl-D-erythritol 2,4-cyclodiphosphate synthase [Microbulbifer sp. YPW1]QKX17870.1 2-C-methyl-D-erythritol 2,4-cyclodiphosphate synthase [Microbulbifer sp. YPW1]